MSGHDRQPYGPPPGLTEEERREWWERQRSKFVWGPGDIVMLGKDDGKKPEGEDESPGS